ncbi:cytochrome c-type biogenesis protein CcmH [Phenylobacterium sp. J426]|uniref:cytochrome c-type biogenesis protein n=1 Tax=Phenylobacterium sp. J426 TaxID=2898439 RepID=UPI002150CEF1|nr:cytochrome c-type biogenesis protein [Phenylobacterium sp. J426]MCR5872951.1 cytochrome c-type biogenesis protein CcmH [Phenylobacterium sp. J426]
MRLRALLAIAFGALSIAAASDPAERLPDPAQEARAREIFRDVRCLVCQNESIDDSEAELAKDLRALVREQVAAGKSEGEVKQFLTQRYGEFVLLTPSFNAWNLALWIGPFVVVLAGIALLLMRLRARGPEPELSEEETRRLKKIADPETR